MAKIEDITKTPASSLPNDMIDLCNSVKSKRAKIVIDHILEYGIITTEELNEFYKYDHPPRAIRDVRENGIPLITHKIISSKTGRNIAAYTFDDVSKIKAGRVGGRKAFPKQFKQQLIDLYGSRDAITLELLDDRYLQIDHRIPYEIIGDSSIKLDPYKFMLLDASSNRAKSWSCENCDNFLHKHNPKICESCFWASPENYLHIAEVLSRRLEIVWTGDEINAFEALRNKAKEQNLEIAEYIKKILLK